MYSKPMSGLFRHALAAAVLIAGAAQAAYSKPASPDVYRLSVTSDAAGRVPATEFNCREKVYAFLRLPRAFTGKHMLTADWYRPDGSRQESTKVDVDLTPPGRNTVYLWLQCHPPRVEDVSDVFFHSDDGSEFDGSWHVEVFWDGRAVQTGHFSMVCP